MIERTIKGQGSIHVKAKRLLGQMLDFELVDGPSSEEEMYSAFGSVLGVLWEGDTGFVTLEKPAGPFDPRLELRFTPSSVEYVSDSEWKEFHSSILAENDCYNVYVRPWYVSPDEPRNLYVTFSGGDFTGHLEKLKEFPCQPYMLITAGDNVTAIWRASGVLTWHEWARLSLGIANYFGTDTAVRSLRVPVPGTETIDEAGRRQPVKVVLWESDEVHDYEAFRSAIGCEGLTDAEVEKAVSDANAAAFEKEGRWIGWRELSHIGNGEGGGYIPRYVPDGAQVGKEGVLLRGTNGGVGRWALNQPLWVEGIVQAVESREAEIKLLWLSHGLRIERALMPMSYLADRKALSAFLYAHNITAFEPTKQAEVVREYLRGCVNAYNKQKPAEDSHRRLGWFGDGFVLGNSLITPSGSREANLGGVPSEMKSGLDVKGASFETWRSITMALCTERYWKHQFTLLSVLGSPLLAMMGVDGAVISLAGESGVGKSTSAKFGLSAFGSHKSLEIAPQSTEKAFHEKFRILQNLPLLCNEAATIDLRKLNNIVYAAANGEPRDTLTQKVELRSASRWSMLTVFTSNNHLHGLDDKVLNEAGRRRVLELTIDVPLDSDLAQDMNRFASQNYGSVGRDFMEYIVRHPDRVKQQLDAALQWVLDQGVPQEDRFSAWIIASAKVAGEIGDRLGFVLFDSELPCLKAIESVKLQSSETRTSGQLVEEAIGDFIDAHNGYFTMYVSTTGTWTDEGARGEVVGRITSDGKTKTIAISRKAFTTWCRERGIDSKQISAHIIAKGIKETSVKITSAGKSVRCLIIAISEEDAGASCQSSLLTEILDSSAGKPSQGG